MIDLKQVLFRSKAEFVSLLFGHDMCGALTTARACLKLGFTGTVIARIGPNLSVLVNMAIRHDIN